jgi:S1-C subfamily serine protease
MKLGGTHMKKYISGLITGIIICFMVTGLATSIIRQAYFTDVRLQLNGEDISSDYPPVAVETDETKIYGSIRSIAEAMGGSVEWSPGAINIEKPYNMDKIEKYLPSVGKIVSYKNGKEIGRASGVYYNGKILTCKHIIDGGADEHKVILGNTGYVYETGKLETYGDIDFATIEINVNESLINTPIKFGDSDKLVHGDKLYTISSPHGVFNSVGGGVFGDIGVNPEVGEIIGFYTNHAEPGSSGGGLFNQNGELVGIISLDYDGAYGGAIPINKIKEFLK